MTRLPDLLLRVLTAAALVVSGLIHLRLAPDYPTGSPITQQTAFQLQAVVVFTLAAGVLGLPRGRRALWALAALVAAGSLAALLVSRYWAGTRHLPILLYEPAWFTEKVQAAVAEAVATLTSLAGWWLAARARRSYRSVS